MLDVKNYFCAAAITFLLFFFSSCARQHVSTKYKTPLFVAMPSNHRIFDNLAPLLYEAVYKRFTSSGWTLVQNAGDGYQLKINITEWKPQHRFISKDVVLLHEQRNFGLIYRLYNFTHDIVFEQKQSYTVLLSRPQNPLMNTQFMHFELEQLFGRIARDIERSIRQFLAKRADDDVI